MTTDYNPSTQSSNPSLDTFDELRTYAASQGYTLTDEDRLELSRIENQITEQQNHQIKQQKNLIVQFMDGLIQWFPTVIMGIQSISRIAGSIVTNLFTAIISVFGLIALAALETYRVALGVELFHQGSQAASLLTAGILVACNIFVGFTIYQKEQEENLNHQKQAQASLRIWWQRLRYFIGWESNWQRQYKSSASGVKRFRAVVTFSLLILALTGSMKGIIEDTSGAWYEALYKIATESTLLQMSEWLNGLLTAIVAVMGTHVLTEFSFNQNQKALKEATKEANTSPLQKEIDREKSAYLMSKIVEFNRKREEKAAQAAARREATLQQKAATAQQKTAISNATQEANPNPLAITDQPIIHPVTSPTQHQRMVSAAKPSVTTNGHNPQE